MILAKKIVYDFMRAYTPLTTALGNSDKIIYMFPQDFTSLPILSYQEANQSDTYFADDTPIGINSEIQVDIWTGAGTSTTAISVQVDAVFTANLWTKTFSSDVPDPDSRIQHRVIRYQKVIKT